jgi:hypothetical protein
MQHPDWFAPSTTCACTTLPLPTASPIPLNPHRCKYLKVPLPFLRFLLNQHLQHPRHLSSSRRIKSTSSPKSNACTSSASIMRTRRYVVRGAEIGERVLEPLMENGACPGAGVAGGGGTTGNARAVGIGPAPAPPPMLMCRLFQQLSQQSLSPQNRLSVHPRCGS